MKTPLNFKLAGTLSVPVIVLFILSTCLTACKKDNNGLGAAAYLMATNSAEASPPQDCYVDNNKINGAAMAYTQSTNYVLVSIGNHQVQFRTPITATVNSSFSQSFSSNKYYSIFYINDKSSIVTEDDRTTPQPGKARVRFINLSPMLNSGIDFAITGGSQLVEGLAYKAVSVYNDVDAATTFSLSVSGSNSVLLSIPGVVQAGRIYTIYISGNTLASVGYHVIVQN
jgi:hypothetical protein